MIADARLTLDFGGGGGKPLDDRIREFTCGAGRVRLWSPQAYVGYAVYSGVITAILDATGYRLEVEQKAIQVNLGDAFDAHPDTH